jgi:MoxR-like ATPase
MRVTRRVRLPLAALLRAYARTNLPSLDELCRLPGFGTRCRAVLAARGEFLNEPFLAGACDENLRTALNRFYRDCVQPPLHVETLLQRAGLVRHALNHLLHGGDPLAQRLEQCCRPTGAYYVAGLGPSFWSAIVQGLHPKQILACTPAILLALERLGLAAEPALPVLQQALRQMQTLAPGLTALHADHFLNLVAQMHGRDLWSGADALQQGSGQLAVGTALQQVVRTRVPLRRRLEDSSRILDEARQFLEEGLAAEDGVRLRTALSRVDPIGVDRAPIRWKTQTEGLTLWIGRLWEAHEPYEMLEAFWRADPIHGAGLWLPAAVLHLRDPAQFQLWNETVRHGYARLDDGLDGSLAAPEAYRLFNEGVHALGELFRIHPLETADVLAALATEAPGREDEEAAQEQPFRRAASRSRRGPVRTRMSFGGFSDDTFLFLGELAANNQRTWMESQRDRYHFSVREPLVELCRTLTDRYVQPVLAGDHGWILESAARTGRALTSIAKNDYGRTTPYYTELWITFYRRGHDRAADMQFFVRVQPTGLSYGVRLGEAATQVRDRLRRQLATHGDLVQLALDRCGAFAECRFAAEDSATTNPNLADWVEGAVVCAAKVLPADAALLKTEELVGDILLTFDRLLPLYACAVLEDPREFLTQRAGLAGGPRFTEADFCRATYLDAAWLRRARQLLELKRQLILQGVPGTGKTHVAQSLARLLTNGCAEAVRLVQFHPAFTYEEFVEGIKVRSVQVDGRAEVCYPVEDGLLCSFAAEASRKPAQPFVLIIDEINRGNLPRIFGELLYLLEYRGASVSLPYSRREFRLPDNLYVIGTMNAADRSVALLDQALRRRFSFLDMAPDAKLLRIWLERHPPVGGAGIVEKVVSLFQRVNERLQADLGSHCQVGHSYFMVANLNETRLQIVWDHHVRPLLEEYFHGHPERVAAYDLDKLLHSNRSRKRQPAAVP